MENGVPPFGVKVNVGVTFALPFESSFRFVFPVASILGVAVPATPGLGHGCLRQQIISGHRSQIRDPLPVTVRTPGFGSAMFVVALPFFLFLVMLVIAIALVGTNVAWTL